MAEAFRLAFQRSLPSATLLVRRQTVLLCSYSHLVRFVLVFTLVGSLSGTACLRTASAFTPQSPEVREIIDRAIEYLATAREHRQGGKCLIGLVFLKERQPEHARVKEALDAALAYAGQPLNRIASSGDTYAPALVVMFLCELDPDLYRSEIEKVLTALWQRQTTAGAWTYAGQVQGDTSQSQYAVLACWAGHRNGFEVPSNAVLNVCQWLARTQDLKGGFGYHPVDPGANSNRVTQKEVRESVSLAGLGSLYVCSTLLGLNPLVHQSTGEVQAIPDAFVPVPVRGSGSLDVRLNRGLANEIKRAMKDGNKWYTANYTISPVQYTYYYLYALERYQSFRELTERKPQPEPSWYNDGVQYLQRTQTEDGHWPTPQGFTGAAIDACFAVLFLQRSTQKAIRGSQFGEGLLVGGRGLPSDTRRIRMVDGRVVSAMERRSAAALARVLSDPNSPDFEALKRAGEALLIDPAGTTAEDQRSLRRLARSGSVEVRRLAIRALATQRELDNVPTFIAALSADDPTLMLEARDALRQMSRKFDGFGLPSEPTPQQLNSAILAWKEWFLEIRPDTVFLD